MSDTTTGEIDEQTDVALEGLRLAKERTFAAAVRTALALIGFGVAIAKLLPELQPEWVAQTIATMLVIGGGITALAGFGVTLKVIAKLHAAGIKETRWFVIIITLILMVTTTLALLLVGLY